MTQSVRCHMFAMLGLSIAVFFALHLMICGILSMRQLPSFPVRQLSAAMSGELVRDTDESARFHTALIETSALSEWHWSADVSHTTLARSGFGFTVKVGALDLYRDSIPISTMPAIHEYSESWDASSLISTRQEGCGLRYDVEIGWPLRWLTCHLGSGVGDHTLGSSRPSLRNSWSSHEDESPLSRLSVRWSQLAIAFGCVAMVLYSSSVFHGSLVRRVRSARGRCVFCGYSTRATCTGHPCPECGTNGTP